MAFQEVKGRVVRPPFIILIINFKRICQWFYLDVRDFEYHNVVRSELVGDHNSLNTAICTQVEHHIGDFDFTAGLRLEYFEMDGERGDSDFMISKKDSTILPFYPVARSGFHYALGKFTHLRASIGQGIRYPAVGERFIQTNVGALNIFPNADLKPEIGWAGEIGFKQGANWRLERNARYISIH